ncbi:helix-turn-helix domain-containing protein [Sinomicrobium kalidii]|uniref:GlxA family transcriptional regulator n=1 Tax=Sinomicrobium kalidii TaxID=2900738 RepID=UPI001E4259A5|nr:helix-turn-helix domain-containing protein [Sinomicrobium kalidii]UGU16138.1 helix-turn-helix domain-containing protein [Sinomicrobium kalidii]
MKHISILVPDGQSNLTTISSIVGAYEIFIRANAYWEEKQQKTAYTIELVGAADKVDVYKGLFSVRSQKHISEVPESSLIVIPSLVRSYEKALKGNRLLVKWIKEQYKNGAEVASMCTGAFLLASTGLLDGKSCSTHWAAGPEFRERFPGINLKTDKLITYQDGLYTNGGAFSFLNLIVYLVEKYYDRQTALYCAKVFQIDMGRNLQSEFCVFNGHKKHGDKEILEVQAYFESHYQNKISIKELSEKLNIGRRNFDRRFIKATGITPLEYLQRVRVEVTKNSLENTRKTVSEIMYDVGYNDDKAFRNVFSRFTGISPNDYKSKYNKEDIRY